MDLLDKLTASKPLALAANFPADVQRALDSSNNYPALFELAFGSREISPSRLVMAIASYERSLVADQTPWDHFMKTGEYLPGTQSLGWDVFKKVGCIECHEAPLFTDNAFHNIGLRPYDDDTGRMEISGDPQQRGSMKTPSLRNAALKTRFMHTGQYNSLDEVVDSYADVPFADMAGNLPSGKKYDFNLTESERTALLSFLRNSLTDPRVEKSIYPFDRPSLRSESMHADPLPPIDLSAIQTQGGAVQLSWSVGGADFQALDYEIVRDGENHAWTSNKYWVDNDGRSGR